MCNYIVYTTVLFKLDFSASNVACFCRWQEGVFTNRRLYILSLDNNFITSIEPRVFDESANLSVLWSIDLSNNDITDLEPWPLIRAQHHVSTAVYLFNNRITRFTNALQWSFNCSLTFVVDLSRNDIHHITDFMNGWNISGTIQWRYYAVEAALRIASRLSPSVCPSGFAGFWTNSKLW